VFLTVEFCVCKHTPYRLSINILFSMLESQRLRGCMLHPHLSIAVLRVNYTCYSPTGILVE
jgi:hypothetical protein